LQIPKRAPDRVPFGDSHELIPDAKKVERDRTMAKNRQMENERTVPKYRQVEGERLVLQYTKVPISEYLCSGFRGQADFFHAAISSWQAIGSTIVRPSHSS